MVYFGWNLVYGESLVFSHMKVNLMCVCGEMGTDKFLNKDTFAIVNDQKWRNKRKVQT